MWAYLHFIIFIHPFSFFKCIFSQSTFQYSASYWTSSNTYNHVFDLDKGMDREEAKFDAFNKLAFTKICLVFDKSGSKSYLEISKSGSSMISLFSSAYQGMTFIYTYAYTYI